MVMNEAPDSVRTRNILQITPCCRLTLTFRHAAVLTRRVTMIEVWRISEGDPIDFEVVVREGEGETRHNVTMSVKCASG
jgi:hypothetical protein